MSSPSMTLIEGSVSGKPEISKITFSTLFIKTEFFLTFKFKMTQLSYHQIEIKTSHWDKLLQWRILIHFIEDRLTNIGIANAIAFLVIHISNWWWLVEALVLVSEDTAVLKTAVFHSEGVGIFSIFLFDRFYCPDRWC